MDMQNWIRLLSTWNQQDIDNRLDSNIKQKAKTETNSLCAQKRSRLTENELVVTSWEGVVEGKIQTAECRTGSRMYYNTQPVFWEFWLDASQRHCLNGSEVLIQWNPENCLAFLPNPMTANVTAWWNRPASSLRLMQSLTSAHYASCMSHIFPEGCKFD